MITSVVQRTLVKSPPELWAELSDPTALARHLGELGELRITRTEPERTIEWEAGSTCGTVSIKPSGWGTRVTLSASRALDVPTPDEDLLAPESESAEGESAAPAPVEPAPVEPAPVEPAQVGPAQVAASLVEPPPPEAVSFEPPAPAASSHERPSAELDAPLLDTEPDEDPPIEPTSTDAATESPLVESRRGFFARLFGWRKPAAPPRAEPADAALSPWARDEEGAERPHSDALRRLWITPQPSDAPEQEPEPEPERSEADLQPELQEPERQESEQPEPHQREPHEEPHEEGAAVAAHPTDEEPSAADEPEGHADIAAELRAAEEAQTAAVTAVLTAALDRLGAAHHRPFSRS
jgi:hypothetical protein